jgi:bifunctional NMN adenylyltransferase/nudix hydrolase
MTTKYDTIVYIGRFQPVHNGHAATIRRALTLADKVVVIIGSANQPRTYKNPFTQDERLSMIAKVAPLEFQDQSLVIESVEDTVYNDEAWAIEVQSIVSKHSNKSKVAIIGHLKDEVKIQVLLPQNSLYLKQ